MLAAGTTREDSNWKTNHAQKQRMLNLKSMSYGKDLDAQVVYGEP